jgi:hypothetical protein
MFCASKYIILYVPKYFSQSFIETSLKHWHQQHKYSLEPFCKGHRRQSNISVCPVHSDNIWDNTHKNTSWLLQLYSPYKNNVFCFYKIHVCYIFQFCCNFKKDAFDNEEALYESIRITGIDIINLNIVLNINIEFIVYLTMVVVTYIT